MNDYDLNGEESDIYGSSGDILFEVAAELVVTALRKGKESIEEKIYIEKNKEKVRDRLKILEYAEDAKNKKNYYTPNEPEEERLVELIKMHDPEFDKELFEHYAEDVFRKFMYAYCNNEFDSLRKYVDINILEMFRTQAIKNYALKEKEEIQIEAVNYVDFFGYHQEGNIEVVSVALGVNYYDFIKNADGKITKGSDKIKNRSTYLLSFARTSGAQTINNIKDYKDGVAYCPNCGGKITNSYSECEFCHAILYNSTDNWLLTHIEEM